MKQRFTSKTSRILLSLAIVAIIASFALTGFEGLFQSPNVVAEVNGLEITRQEFKRIMDQQLNYYEKAMGDGANRKQLYDSLKGMVLNSLIKERLFVDYSKRIQLTASDTEVAHRIKELPFFQTNDRFDINKYKQLLQANGLTPQEFEENMKKEIVVQHLNNIIETLPVSQNYAKHIQQLKNQRHYVDVIKISPQMIAPLIRVSSSEVEQLLNSADIEQKLQQVYQENFDNYNKPPQASVSHILLNKQPEVELSVRMQEARKIREKLTTKNFGQMAKKYSDDPSSKQRGGELGTITPGKMAPEFEEMAFSLKEGEISQPFESSFGIHIIYVRNKKEAITKSITDDDVRKELAKKIVQKNKTNQRDQLKQKIIQDLQNHYNQGNINAARNLAKKYNFTLEQGQWLNRYDRKVGSITLDPIQSSDIFNDTNNTFSFESPMESLIVYVNRKKQPNEKNKLDDIHKSQSLFMAKKTQTELLEQIQQKAKIKTFQQLL